MASFDLTGKVAPSPVLPMREKQSDGSDHPFHTFLMGKTPAGRWGKPEDLAGPAVFLASWLTSAGSPDSCLLHS